MAADHIDDASEYTEKLLAVRIDEIRASANTRELNPEGFCHNCHEPFEDGSALLFCPGDECSEDYEKRKRAKKMAPVL